MTLELRRSTGRGDIKSPELGKIPNFSVLAFGDTRIPFRSNTLHVRQP